LSRNLLLRVWGVIIPDCKFGPLSMNLNGFTNMTTVTILSSTAPKAYISCLCLMFPILLRFPFFPLFVFVSCFLGRVRD